VREIPRDDWFQTPADLRSDPAMTAAKRCSLPAISKPPTAFESLPRLACADLCRRPRWRAVVAHLRRKFRGCDTPRQGPRGMGVCFSPSFDVAGLLSKSFRFPHDIEFVDVESLQPRRSRGRRRKHRESIWRVVVGTSNETADGEARARCRASPIVPHGLDQALPRSRPSCSC